MKKREKNFKIIRERLDYELELGFKYVDNKVAHLYSGVFGLLVNPIVKFFYTFIARDAIVKRARKQLDVIFQCAGEYDGRNLDKIVDEHFEEYLQTEEVYIRGNRNHPKFREVKKLEREVFKGRLEPIAMLLDGDGETYEELTRSIFPKRGEAEKYCWKQFELADKLIQMVKGERNLVRIPSVIRTEVFAILDSGYAFAKKTLKEQLDGTYK